jgi:hypothetical protein
MKWAKRSSAENSVLSSLNNKGSNPSNFGEEKAASGHLCVGSLAWFEEVFSCLVEAMEGLMNFSGVKLQESNFHLRWEWYSSKTNDLCLPTTFARTKTTQDCASRRFFSYRGANPSLWVERQQHREAQGGGTHQKHKLSRKQKATSTQEPKKRSETSWSPLLHTEALQSSPAAGLTRGRGPRSSRHPIYCSSSIDAATEAREVEEIGVARNYTPRPHTRFGASQTH